MNNKIKVLIGDDSAGTGVSLANKLREKVSMPIQDAKTAVL